MQEVIIKLLKEKNPAPLSGQSMARELGVSRTTVWKKIKALQKEGYVITGSPRCGYIMERIPERICPYELSAKLGTQNIAPDPSYIHCLASVDSTNELLKQMAEQGAPEGTVLIAEKQQQGKGRMGRNWSSPEGKGIYLSILLRPPLPPHNTSPLTLLAAVAACSGIKTVLPQLAPGIKWPNDLLLRGRKCCGVLCELKAEMDLIHYLIAGIGINVNTSLDELPPSLQETATSLQLENNGEKVSRTSVAAAILQHFDELYREYLAAGVAPVLDRWTSSNITLGKKVKIESPNFSFQGVARELDNSGALVVEGVRGERKHFAAGEVTIL